MTEDSRREAVVSVLKPLLQELDEKNVSYCVLRSYEFLADEDKSPGGDFDLLVSEQDSDKAVRVMEENGFFEKSFSPDNAHRGIFYFSSKGKEDVSIDLHVEGFTFAGVPIISGNDILKNRKQRDFFYIPSSEHYTAMLILQSILNNAGFKDKYKSRVQENLDSVDKQDVGKILSNALNPSLAEKLLVSIEEQEYDSLIDMRSELIKAIAVSNPLRVFRMGNTWVSRRVSRRMLALTNLLNPFVFAPCFSFVGSDGSGKSTAVSHTCDLLRLNGLSCKVIRMSTYTARSWPAQKISNIIERFSASSEDSSLEESTEAIVGESPRGSLYNFLRDMLHMFDLSVKFVKIWYYRKRGIVVVTDRYAYDILAYAGETQIKNNFVSLYPSPDKTFYLYNTPDVLKQRKPEFTLEGFEEIVSRYDDIADRFEFCKIKTDDKQETFDRIDNEVREEVISASSNILPRLIYKKDHRIMPR